MVQIQLPKNLLWYLIYESKLQYFQISLPTEEVQYKLFKGSKHVVCNIYLDITYIKHLYSIKPLLSFFTAEGKQRLNAVIMLKTLLQVKTVCSFWEVIPNTHKWKVIIFILHFTNEYICICCEPLLLSECRWITAHCDFSVLQYWYTGNYMTANTLNWKEICFQEHLFLNV